jgi:F0F1-type ATP synthase assembly protein I
MIKLASPKALLTLEAFSLPVLLLVTSLFVETKAMISFGVGFFVCFFSNFLFFGCILLQKKAKLPKQELGLLYAAELTKILLHFSLMVLIFSMGVFSPSALAAGVLSFYLLHIVLTIIVGMSRS